MDFKDFVGRQEASDFTPPLLEKIRERLARKEQVVLLLNRRGYSSFVMCRDCGYVDDCPNCDISLTLHMDTKTMNCHYCDFQKLFLMSVLIARVVRFAIMGLGHRRLMIN